METLFDSIMGLPLHPLVVHAAVVLLPLSALSLMLAAFWPRWGARARTASLALLTVAGVAAFIAKESGEALARHLGTPIEHAHWADRLLPVAALTWLAAAAWEFFSRRRTQRTEAKPAGRVDGHIGDHADDHTVAHPRNASATTSDTDRGSTAAADDSRVGDGSHRFARPLGWLTGVLALATIVVTAIVGHSGATATWTGAEQRVQQGSAAAVERGYDAKQVARHASAASCWTIIDGGVYDVTTWISQHPGGADKILPLCGKDGTAGFTSQHSGDATPQKTLEQYRLGKIAGHGGEEH